MYAIDPATLAARPVPFLNDDEAAAAAGIFALAADDAGGVWVGGINMSTYYLRGETVTAYPVAQVKDIAVAPAGTVYLAARNQVYTLEADGRSAVRPLPGLEAYRARRPFQQCNDLYATRDGRLLMATNSAGLLWYDPGQSVYTAFNSSDGLPTNNVQSVMPDGGGGTWAGTSRGLVRITTAPTDTSVRVFTETDGLLSLEFVDRSVARLADGRLLFGSGRGGSLFGPGAVGWGDGGPGGGVRGVVAVQRGPARR